MRAVQGGVQATNAFSPSLPNSQVQCCLWQEGWRFYKSTEALTAFMQISGQA